MVMTVGWIHLPVSSRCIAAMLCQKQAISCRSQLRAAAEFVKIRWNVRNGVSTPPQLISYIMA